jgi:hypothetical protein
MINVFKALGFLTADGVPTERYYRYLDQTQGGRVLAEGIREAYADLFQLNKDAHALARSDVKNKMKTLTRGAYSDNVLNKMAMTFEGLVKQADWSAPPDSLASAEDEQGAELPPATEDEQLPPRTPGVLPLDGLVYRIEIHLPDSRDQAVYDALFRSLRAHLFH